jgi:hypothetical protein
MSEFPFFKTLHNETKPVGDFGRGTHYSVMRVPIWRDTLLRPMHQGAMLDFAIIWDEDHDERVLKVIERIYFAGLLAPVRFIGERKGTLSVLIAELRCASRRRTGRICAAPKLGLLIQRNSSGSGEPSFFWRPLAD